MYYEGENGLKQEETFGVQTELVVYYEKFKLSRLMENLNDNQTTD